MDGWKMANVTAKQMERTGKMNARIKCLKINLQHSRLATETVDSNARSTSWHDVLNKIGERQWKSFNKQTNIYRQRRNLAHNILDQSRR